MVVTNTFMELFRSLRDGVEVVRVSEGGSKGDVSSGLGCAEPRWQLLDAEVRPSLAYDHF